MTWKMKVEEIEGVLDKVWDLHDKLSDAIHSITRTHFLRSVNSSSLPTNSDDNRTGFVFAKGFPVNDCAIRDARSLNSIRTALENLQDQLEFVHTVKIQQRAERGVAIARLEQSRIVLALRLGEHQGKNFKVIDEARAFVGAVHDATNFASPGNVCGSAASPSGENVCGSAACPSGENVCGSAACPSRENCLPQDVKESNVVFKVLISGLNFAKKTIRVNHFNGILGNAALVAVSMLALLHLQKVSSRITYISRLPQKQEDNNIGKNVSKVFQPGRTSSNALAHMDVLLARG